MLPPLKCLVLHRGTGRRMQAGTPTPKVGREPQTRPPQVLLVRIPLQGKWGAVRVCSKRTPTELTPGFSICSQQEKGELSPSQAINCLSRISLNKRKEIYLTQKNSRTSVRRDTSQKLILAAKGILHLEGTSGWKAKKGSGLALHSRSPAL